LLLPLAIRRQPGLALADSKSGQLRPVTHRYWMTECYMTPASWSVIAQAKAPAPPEEA
jgi:hypothetical protein